MLIKVCYSEKDFLNRAGFHFTNRAAVNRVSVMHVRLALGECRTDKSGKQITAYKPGLVMMKRNDTRVNSDDALR